MKTDYYVYTIEYERDGAPCYFGVGRGRRMGKHFIDGRLKLTGRPLYQYLQNCEERGVKLQTYKVAEDLTKENALAYERVLVAWYGRRDINTGCLLNISNGGVGERNLSPATRKILSDKAKKNEKSLAALKPYQTKGSFERNMSPEVLVAGRRKGQQACVAANTGAKRTDEARARMRKPHVVTSKVKAAAALRGEKQRGQKRSLETRAKMRASQLNKKRSPEARANMRAARLAYLAKQKGGEDG